MLETIELPKDKQALAAIIDQHVTREQQRLSYKRAIWLVAFYYMLGARNFDIFDPMTGNVHFKWLSEDDSMEFQSTELLSAIDRIAGRLASTDMRPLITRTGNSLNQIRQRAIAQVIGDSLVSDQQLQGVLTKYSHYFTLLGSCGLIGHITDHPTIGLSADIEVIHPQELMPFPSTSLDYTKQWGIVRQRMVPFKFLEKKFGRRIQDNIEKMMLWRQVIGTNMEMEGNQPPIGGAINFPQGGPTGGAETAEKIEMVTVRVRELWVNGPNEICNRYVMTSGEYVIEDIDTEGLEVYCPIGFDRFMENGTFHGAGGFDLLFPMIREAEKMAKALFKNIRDLDRYGVLVLPHGSFNANTMLRDIGRGLRVFPWEPDPISEGFKPFSIQPFNTGDTPGKVAQFALEQLDRVNPLQDLIREKGRVDSAVGLSFLDEQINRAMTTPSRGVQHTFATVYRAIVSDATREVMLTPRAIPVGHLTTDLAGAVVDPETLEVSFRNNPIPDVSKLSFGVRQTHPRSEVARKQEALQLQTAFGIDVDSFILFAMKESLDFAMWSDEHQSAYEMVVRNIVFLYGDGITPGRIVIVPQMTKPELQIRVLNAFMGGPIMAVASVKVQNEFIQYHQALTEFMGLTLPSAVPNPDDIALLTAIEQQAQQQAQPQLEAGVAQ